MTGVAQHAPWSMASRALRVGLLATHPIQYYAPWYRALSKELDLTVFYAHRASAGEQGEAGFGVTFDWDIPILEGYCYQFLWNRARKPNASTFAGCDTPDIASAIRDAGFDAFIVHGWYSRSYLQAIRACRRYEIPLLVRGDSQLRTVRSPAKRALKYPLYRLLLTSFDACLCVGERAREYYRHYGARDEQLFFAPHAVDNDFFASRAAALSRKRCALRQAFGVPEGAVTFLFAGKLIEKKRPKDLLKAAQLLTRAGAKAHVLVVGDGPLRAEMEAYTRAHSLPVSFAGFLNQSRIVEAYVAADVLVLPSDARETWGLVVNEGMACGLPALVSEEVGCAPDLVKAGFTGNTFPCGDTEQLSSLMVRWSEDRGLLDRARRSAADHIRRYSISAAVAGTVSAIKALQSGEAPGEGCGATAVIEG